MGGRGPRGSRSPPVTSRTTSRGRLPTASTPRATFSPGEGQPAVVPSKRLRKVLQEEEPEGRVEVVLDVGVGGALVRRVLERRSALGMRPAPVPPDGREEGRDGGGVGCGGR